MNFLAAILIIVILAIVAMVAIVAGLIWLGQGVASALGPTRLATVLPVAAAVGVAVYVALSVGVSKRPDRAAAGRNYVTHDAHGGSRKPGGMDEVSEPIPPPDFVPEANSLTHAEAPDSASAPADIAPTEPLIEPSGHRVPDWIEDPPRTVHGKFRTHIVAGPYDRTLDCETELDQKLVAEARQYVEREFGAGLVEPSLEYLRTNVVADEHVESTRHEFGGVSQPMYQVYRLLEFDEADRNYFAELSRDTKVERRLAYTGFGLTSVLLLLSTAFGYLRIDQATAGRYRRRLQLATTAVILGLLGGAVVFVRLVPLV